MIEECPNSEEYYMFSVSLYGKSADKIRPQPITRLLFSNDDMPSRGKYGWSHTAAIAEAAHLCHQLNISLDRIFFRRPDNVRARRLTEQEKEIGGIHE